MMREMKRETTILFSTHVLHDAQEISDDLLIMHDGNIAVSGEMKQVIRQHQQPIIKVEFESSADDWLQTIKSYNFVSGVTVQGYEASIVLNDMDTGKQTLLKEIAERGLPIRKFEMAQTTLEDLFMKVVKA